MARSKGLRSLVWPVAFALSSLNEVRAEEINPPSTIKFRTQPEPGMPGVPDFSVLAKQNLSYYDDTTGTITITGNKLNRHLSHHFQTRHGLANGYISAEISFYGPFFEEDKNQTHASGKVTHGWPVYNPRKSFASVSGFYDCHDPEDKIGVNYPELLERGCESIVSGIPYFYGLGLEVGGRRLDGDVDESEISEYVGSLEMKSGLAKRSYVWSPRGMGVEFEIEYTMLASRTRPNVAATRLRVTPRGSVKGSLVDILDGRSAVRSKIVEKGVLGDDTIYITNHPDGRPYLQAWMVSNVGISTADATSRRQSKDSHSSSSIGQEWDVNFVDGETVTFTKFVGVAESQHFENPEKIALDAAGKAYTDGWDTILSEHVKAWNSLMDNNLMPSYRDPSTGLLPENNKILNTFQASSTSDRFNLMQNLLPEDGLGLNDGGLSVGGIASEAYAGMVFWDMDFWMYPSIALTSPSYARQMVNFRLKHFKQAKQNAQEDYVQEKYKFDEDAVLYSWTTGGFGNATGTGPVLDYEYHLNTDVALMMFQHRLLTGDEVLFRKELWPVIMGVGSAMTTLLQKDGEGWSIRNMTDPDEFANNVDNGAFTLHSIAKVLSLIISYQEANSLQVNETWRHMSRHLNIPTAPSGLTLEYANMPSIITAKQADVILINLLSPPPSTYPLSTAQLDHNYYSHLQSPDGPAMTNAIYTITSNQILSSGCETWERDVEARMQNLRAPWFQMSEQVDDDANNNGGYPPAFPFLTGHGGSSMIVPLGYLGIKMLEDVLTIRPSLPPPLRNLGIPDFWWRGNRIRAVMNTTHTSLTRLPADGKAEGVYDVYKGKAMLFVVQRRDLSQNIIVETTHKIEIGETVVVGNDMYWQSGGCKASFEINREGRYGGSEGTGWQIPFFHWTPKFVFGDTSGAEIIKKSMQWVGELLR